MNRILMVLLVISRLTFAESGGSSTGTFGGGSAWELEFGAYALYALEIIEETGEKELPEELKNLDIIKLKNNIETAIIIPKTNLKLPIGKSKSIPRVALNDSSSNTIYLDVWKWSYVKQSIRSALAVAIHEYLGLLEYEKSSYHISRAFYNVLIKFPDSYFEDRVVKDKLLAIKKKNNLQVQGKDVREKASISDSSLDLENEFYTCSIEIFKNSIGEPVSIMKVNNLQAHSTLYQNAYKKAHDDNNNLIYHSSYKFYGSTSGCIHELAGRDLGFHYRFDDSYYLDFCFIMSDGFKDSHSLILQLAKRKHLDERGFLSSIDYFGDKIEVRENETKHQMIRYYNMEEKKFEYFGVEVSCSMIKE